MARNKKLFSLLHLNKIICSWKNTSKNLPNLKIRNLMFIFVNVFLKNGTRVNK